MTPLSTTIKKRSLEFSAPLLAAPVAGTELAAATPASQALTPQELKEEAVLFTPPGFDHVGEAKWDGTVAWTNGGRTGQVEIVVRDPVTGQRTPCRINVVGRDGHFYRPGPNRLSRFALTGVHSPTGTAKGNRLGKAPYRYVGRFFYSAGESTVRVPDGAVYARGTRRWIESPGHGRPHRVSGQSSPLGIGLRRRNN